MSQRFIYGVGDIQVPQCARCNHKNNDTSCDAFPGGIPEPLLRDEYSHTKPFKGDNGIRFEPIKTKTVQDKNSG